MQRGLAIVCLLLLPLTTLADGGVYIHSSALAKDISIPDQRALLCWSNGVERLAIETRFEAEGTNFAWVVPLPAKPVIEEATTGLFSTLQYIFRPRVIHHVPPFFAMLLVCVGLAYLLLSVRRDTRPRVSDTLVSVAVAVATFPFTPCFAMFVLVLLPYAVWRVRIGKENWSGILGAIVIAMVLGSLFLPGLSRSGPMTSASNVSILGHELVGVYDTTTVASKDTRALIQWLEQNDYVVPPGADEVISNYVERGWVFVAAKLHRDSAGRAAGAPHPLCFTFQTDKAVYPMQLTGSGNAGLAVDLFVFGPSQAHADSLHVERCASPVPARDERNSTGSPDDILISHPLLLQWTGNLPVATKLSGTLTPAMMAQDIELHWAPFSEVRQTFYSYQGAVVRGLNWGIGIATACLFLASLVVAVKVSWQRWLRAGAGWMALGGFLVAAVVFFATPKTAVRLVRAPRAQAVMNVLQLAAFFQHSSPTNRALSLVESRALIKSILTNERIATGGNVLLGGAIREEDSPGNYVLRQSTNGVEFLWFDENGGEHRGDE